LCWGLTELSRGATRNGDGSGVLGPAAAVALTVLLLTMLWRRIHRVQHPLIYPQLLRDRVKAGVYVSTFAVGMLQQGPLVVLAIYLQLGRGMSVADSGWHLSGMAVGMMLGAICAGQCARFWPAQRLCMLAMGWMLAALLATLLCLFARTDELLALALGLLGFGVALFVTPSNQMLMQNCPADHRGVVNALRAAIQNAGMLSGIAWLMLMMSLALPSLGHGSALTDGADAGSSSATDMRESVAVAVATLAAILIAGMLGVARLWKLHKRKARPCPKLEP
jgi:predicted MFS family arabinose efflux permease